MFWSKSLPWEKKCKNQCSNKNKLTVGTKKVTKLKHALNSPKVNQPREN